MKNLTLYIDLVFCLIVLPLMVVLSPVERWFHNFTVYMILAGIWLYAVYAVNRFLTVPFLFGSRKKRAMGWIIIIVSVGITFMFSRVELYIPKPNVHDIGIVRRLPQIQPYKQALWTLFMIVETFSFAVGLLLQTNLQKARRREAESERDKAELALYKAQIKPHFMFNTLNSLYGLFLTDSPNALPSLEKYISMMRYIHFSSTRDLVPVSEEAEYIREYSGIQSLRLSEMTRMSLNIDIESEDLMIPPMLLVTFVENCFKHGISPVEESSIDISLTEKNGIIAFTTCNRIFNVCKEGSGIGIENCRRRLDLLFPDRYDLKITNDGILYKVSLNINLENDKMCRD